MTSLSRRVVGIVLLTAFVAAAGAWAGVAYGLRESRESAGLDDIVHHELNLTREQESEIANLESQFATRRRELNLEMRAANRDLSAAIMSEHSYGPRAEGAIERFHSAMGTLQEETVKHVLAMRAILTSEQAEQFDGIVARALSSDGS
jgi:nickel and cobalt resistance protein CnrR